MEVGRVTVTRGCFVANGASEPGPGVAMMNSRSPHVILAASLSNQMTNSSAKTTYIGETLSATSTILGTEFTTMGRVVAGLCNTAWDPGITQMMGYMASLSSHALINRTRLRTSNTSALGHQRFCNCTMIFGQMIICLSMKMNQTISTNVRRPA